MSRELAEEQSIEVDLEGIADSEHTLPPCIRDNKQFRVVYAGIPHCNAPGGYFCGYRGVTYHEGRCTYDPQA